ncbi:MAG TPA: M20 family metallo-hydrolase [Candidatus Sulfotelmatobacter sp.]|nr:M20 family metallo-hydrolase [Candidatus Sulfotelmatobacter sp.]
MIGHAAVNLARLQSDLDALAEFREPDQTGWTRRVFSDPYIRSRKWLAQTMRDAGLQVTCDAAGNLIGVVPGERPALVTGSHTDTVAGGGRFDGPLGVLAAIEVARCIVQSGRELTHELRVVDFVGEEPNEFGISCVGSRAVAGTLSAAHLALRDPSGGTLAGALESVGGDSGRIVDSAWREGEVHAFVELHIEQGPVLEDAGIPIGIVSGIAGIERLHMTFEGEAGHAGTTPMRSRNDALCAAAEAVLAVEQVASRGDGVGTAGRIEAKPGALNVIPGHVELWAELRHTSKEWLDAARRDLETAATEIGARRGVRTTIDHLSRTEPVICSEVVRAAMSEALGDLGLASRTLPSGAGHDTVQMARLAPVGMLFVPSVGGRSHCPEELTLPQHLDAGASALMATLLVLDAR